MSRESQIYIEEIFQISNTLEPTRVLISRGLTNSLELNIGLFHQKQARYEVYQLDMRQPRQIRCVIDQHGIQEAVQLRFVRTGEANQVVSRTQGINISEGSTRVTSS
jgi:hypothetical protein